MSAASTQYQAGIESAGSESQQLFDLANEIEKARKAYLDAMGNDTLAVAERLALQDVLWNDKGTIAYAVRIAAQSIEREPSRAEIIAALKTAHANFMATGVGRESDERYEDMADSVRNLYPTLASEPHP